MNKKIRLDWLPIFFGLLGALLVLVLASGPGVLAGGQLFGTIPTPTSPVTIPPRHSATPVPSTLTPPPPGETPGTPPPGTPGLPTPTPGGPPATTATQSAPGGPRITITQQVSRPDVLPGEEIQYSFLVANTGTGPVTGLVLGDELEPALQLLRVSATQGSADVNGRTWALYLGILETGQTALVQLDVRIAAGAQAGQIILNLAAAYYEGEQAASNLVAVGLPPDRLPPTGGERRWP